MPVRKPEQLELPLEYLSSVSDGGLESFELTQLSIARNLDKEIEAMRYQRDRAQVLADLARLLLMHRKKLLQLTKEKMEGAA